MDAQQCNALLQRNSLPYGDMQTSTISQGGTIRPILFKFCTFDQVADLNKHFKFSWNRFSMGSSPYVWTTCFCVKARSPCLSFHSHTGHISHIIFTHHGSKRGKLQWCALGVKTALLYPLWIIYLEILPNFFQWDFPAKHKNIITSKPFGIHEIFPFTTNRKPIPTYWNANVVSGLRRSLVAKHTLPIFPVFWKTHLTSKLSILRINCQYLEQVFSQDLWNRVVQSYVTWPGSL
jgi:hypothetical protein